jgi:Niemann-Pick C1 protein
LAQLEEICGPSPDPSDPTSKWTNACCTSSQLETLQGSLMRAEPLLALCPACRLNFRSFYCSFTCSPDQSQFVTVIETQDLGGGNGGTDAVKDVAFHVDEKFGEGFFDSCKNVKFGATNGYAMEFLGGGATEWTAFLRYMGQEVTLDIELLSHIHHQLNVFLETSSDQDWGRRFKLISHSHLPIFRGTAPTL